MFNKQNVMSIFFESPTMEFSVREVARFLHISPATASKNLRRLANDGILKYRKERILDLYSANMESDFYRDAKVYYMVTKIRRSGLIEKLNRFYLKPTIIIFGSAINGLDTEDSDVDIVIISENQKEFKEKMEYEKRIGRKFQFFIVKSLQELRNPHLINNVLNGMVIQGELRWT